MTAHPKALHALRALRIATPLIVAASACLAFDCRKSTHESPPTPTTSTSASTIALTNADAVGALEDVALAGEGDAETIAALDAPGPPKPRLVSKVQFLFVYGEPRHTSLKQGYLRAGATVERDETSAGDAGCKGGWYGVRPKGFVCLSDGGTLDLDDAVARIATRRPDLSAPLPYAYGVARNSMSPFYVRVPTRKEAAGLEYDVNDAYQRSQRAMKAPVGDAGPEYDANVWSEGPPWWLQDGGAVPNVSGLVSSPRALHAGRPKAKEGFAIVSSFVSGPGGSMPDGGVDDRRYDVTTDYLIVPHDRMREVRPSAFAGSVLDPTNPLPVAFVKPRHHATKLKFENDKATTPESLPPRTMLFLTGESKRISGVEYLATKDGAFVKASEVVKLEAPKQMPAFAKKGDKWIDVSIARQSLIAFEGEKAVYATLVSTGRDGLGDPETMHATIRGLYRIHTKHATMTMDSNEVGEAFSLRDVPYVMYFESGYALHAAYWHDGFGEPRSHGCINLPETDAAWLFAWTGPELPAGWHGVFARPMSSGTQIWIHP